MEDVSKGTNIFKKEDYRDILEHTFSDIVRLSNGDKELFEELYYNRDFEFNDFRNEAENLYVNGNNILVIGNAGSGKTNYIYRLFYDSEIMEKAKLYPMLFDYRNIVPSGLIGIKMNFIREFDKFFKLLDYDINLKSNEVSNIDDNLFKINSEIFTIPLEKFIKHPILFIDDLDYAEHDQLFELLDFITPYTRNKNIHILLSVRPPLYYTIKKNDFKYNFLFINNVKKITLRRLNVHNVLSTRMAPLIIFKQDQSFFKSVLHKIGLLKNRDRKYIKILKKLGVENLEQLKEFSYPFTNDYVKFMDKITNGNFREIFRMAIESLNYIFENYDKLETVIQDGCERKIIPDDDTVDIFTNKEATYTFFNVHKLKNKNGNSIYFNVLEAIKAFGGSYDGKFFEYLQKFGHEKNDINKALQELSDKENRFILDKNCSLGSDIREYEIEEKGEYYLDQIVNWNRYKEKFGTSKQSIRQAITDEMQ